MFIIEPQAQKMSVINLAESLVDFEDEGEE
jgi:hypothetical protein